jgi:hypothetical protein
VIYGIDPSSKTIAVVKLTDDGVYVSSRKYVLMETAGVEAVGWAFKCWRRYCATNKIGKGDLVVIEGAVLAGARNIQSTIKIAYLNGVIQGVSRGTGATVVVVSIWEWKRTFTGSGGASKEDVAAESSRRFPALGNDQDLHDAAGIAVHGCEAVDRAGVDG